MKAALGYCSAVIINKPNEETYLTIRLPLKCAATAKELFRGRRVLVTVADTEVQTQPDGIKEGRWRAPIPILTETVPEGEQVDHQEREVNAGVRTEGEGANQSCALPLAFAL